MTSAKRKPAHEIKRESKHMKVDHQSNPGREPTRTKEEKNLTSVDQFQKEYQGTMTQ
jgi:hypothetical protein